MSRSHDIGRRMQSLGEIREIMNSMKNLAFMEMRKLGRLHENQRAVVDGVLAAAADLLAAHPDVLAAPEVPVPVYLLVGSEQGFCGDFNEAVRARLEVDRAARGGAAPPLVAVGRKLASRLAGDDRLVETLDGALVAEEIAGVLNRLVPVLGALQARHGAIALRAVHHAPGVPAPQVQALLPPFAHLVPTAAAAGVAPVLNLAPRPLLRALADHYLFAVLHGILYASLIAECERRVRHLDGSVRHLDDRVTELGRKRQMARQEEIIEEIEVILLSAGEPETRRPPAV